MISFPLFQPDELSISLKAMEIFEVEKNPGHISAFLNLMARLYSLFFFFADT